MRVILVIDRKNLFPHLSPTGFITPESIDMDLLTPHMFFAERDFMEMNSHYKQIIPYLVLKRGQGPRQRLLAYQRRIEHSEARLGGLWSVGFGGHIEPLDRTDSAVASQGLLKSAALREVHEETGLELQADNLKPVGYINSEQNDVSSVHFGVVFLVDLDAYPGSDEEILKTVSHQVEPFQARWLPFTELGSMLGQDRGPDGGNFENWSEITIAGLFNQRKKMAGG